MLHTIIPFWPRMRGARNRAGLSLVELAFAIAVVGALLGAVWKAAGSVYSNADSTLMGQQLYTLVQSVRGTHMGQSKISEGEELGTLNLPLPPDQIGEFKGKKIIYNIWRGPITLMRGNGMGWGADGYNPEFTLVFGGVPRKACLPFVKTATTREMRSALNLVAVYISPSPGKGDLFCLGEDAFCKGRVVADLDEKMITESCEKNNRLSIMFTYGFQQ